MHPRRLPAKSLFSRLAFLAALTLAPKCVLCALAYTGLFGLGVELCGETPAAWSRLLPLAAGLGLLALCIALPRCRRMILIKP